MKKRIWVSLLAVCFFLSGTHLSSTAFTAEAESDDLWAVSYTTYDVTYDAILKMYLKLINGYKTKNYGRHDLFNDKMFLDFDDGSDPRQTIKAVKNNVGYYIDDINQDGIDDLVINATGGQIYELFTMDNGKVRELIRGGGRFDCRRLNNGTLFRWAHGGAAHNDYEIWRMNGTGKVSFAESYFMRPDNINLGDTWYHSFKSARLSNVPNAERVSASEAEKWIDQREKEVVRPRFIPFVAYEKYPEDPWDLGVLAKDNKTSGTVKIRIRKAPEKNAKVIANKQVGTYVKILAKENGYYRIRFGNKEGFVQEEYLIPVTWQDEFGQ